MLRNLYRFTCIYTFFCVIEVGDIDCSVNEVEREREIERQDRKKTLLGNNGKSYI